MLGPIRYEGRLLFRQSDLGAEVPQTIADPTSSRLLAFFRVREAVFVFLDADAGGRVCREGVTGQKRKDIRVLIQQFGAELGQEW